MDLITRNANAAVHQRLSKLAEELDDGTTTYDLALSELRCYATALQLTREALAESLARAQVTPGAPRRVGRAWSAASSGDGSPPGASTWTQVQDQTSTTREHV
jgi:hypothetical protein